MRGNDWQALIVFFALGIAGAMTCFLIAAWGRDTALQRRVERLERGMDSVQEQGGLYGVKIEWNK